jgi:hypothetical protein
MNSIMKSHIALLVDFAKLSFTVERDSKKYIRLFTGSKAFVESKAANLGFSLQDFTERQREFFRESTSVIFPFWRLASRKSRSWFIYKNELAGEITIVG